MIFPRRTCCFEREYVSLLPLVAMTAVREVNERVTYLATTQGHETHEIQKCPPKREPAILTTHTYDQYAAIKALIAHGVADALAEYEAHRSSGNGDDSHESVSGRRIERAALVLKRQVLEREAHIRNCTVGCQIKFATFTLFGNALMWWNFHVKIVGHDAAYGMPWKTLKKMMTDKYCPRGEIKKLEIELWNLKDEVEKYVRGLLDMIQGSVMAFKPKTMQDAIEFATELMDKKIRSLADRQAENKRKLDDTSSNNQKQQ
ncbi:hypothetical protein Tco_0429185 [Tanacetum coccineum]